MTSYFRTRHTSPFGGGRVFKISDFAQNSGGGI